jgi:hypothetical protein
MSGMVSRKCNTFDVRRHHTPAFSIRFLATVFMVSSNPKNLKLGISEDLSPLSRVQYHNLMLAYLCFTQSKFPLLVLGIEPKAFCMLDSPQSWAKNHPQTIFFFSFFFWWHWGLNSAGTLTAWATLPALFCVGYFQDTISQTICLGWLWTLILLISAWWVASIMGMSHSHTVPFYFFSLFF